MGILEFIFPKKCLECGVGGRYICGSCLKKTRFSPQVCIECERPSVDGMTHEKCKHPFGMDGAFSIWVYEGVIRKAIVKLKYNFVFEIAGELADYASDYLSRNQVVFPKSSFLTPIPLHWQRGNWRGFNQAEEIGRLIAKKMDRGFIPDLLIRKKMLKPQTELKGKERLKNIRGVFSLSSRNSSSIIHTPIILFDDVLTTGATLREASGVLKRGGAGTVWGLTIAR